MPDLGQLPSTLRAHSRWRTLAGVPALVVTPERRASIGAPMLLWMHGRTAHKELDPGRYLRLLRAGIGVVALDLPGHGERLDERLSTGKATLEIVERMVAEIDPVTDAALADGQFDPESLAIGGFSAGGMATLVRLCRPHRFRAAIVEATTGDWSFQRGREMYDEPRVLRMEPISHLHEWRPVPLLILHAERDEWVNVEGQRSFVRALHAHGVPEDLIEFRTFEQTGAPGEHIGFGRHAAEAKDLGVEFLARRLLGP